MQRKVIKKYLDFLEWSKNNHRIISFDTETTSLDYLSLDIIGFSICNGKESMYVNLQSNEAKENILKLLDTVFKFTEKVIMHNSVFDLKVLYKYGIGESLEGKIIDTKIAAFLLEEYRRTGLKFLSGNILGKYRKSWKQITDKYGTNSQQFFDYAAQDAEDTWNLWQIFEKQLIKEDLEYLFYSVEMPFQFVIRDMEINGIGVDRNKLSEFDSKCEKLLYELEVDLLKTLGIKPQIQMIIDGSKKLLCDLDFNSSQQMVKVIEKLGLEIKEKTKPSKTYPDGQKSVGVVTLLSLRGKHPFIEKLHYYRYIRHLYGSFVKKLQPLIQEDGRIRGNFGIAKSGRLRMSNPNLQQNPNDEKYGLKSPIKFREIFIPKPGYKFIIADYSGQELRNLGEVTNDKKIINAFKEGQDLHLVTANYIFNLKIDRKGLQENTEKYLENKITYKQERYKAKNGANFPIIYGTTASGISKRMGVSYQEAKRWMNGFFRLYPNVKKSIEFTKRELESNGFVKTLMGRKRRFPYYNGSDEKSKAAYLRQAFNHKIQGFSADQVKIALSKVRDRIKHLDARIVLQIHDEGIWEVRNDQFEEAKKIIKDCMENAVSLKIPFKVDIKVCNKYEK